MRARKPDGSGHVDCDGVAIYYEVFGSGEPTVLLLPAWMALDSRFWKMQIPYLARHFRVVTYDPPGNGKSDRPLDPAAHGVYAHLRYTQRVLDVTGTGAAVLGGLSQGGEFGISFAALHPERVLGCVLFGSSAPVVDKAATDRGQFIMDHFEQDYPPVSPSRVPLGVPDPLDDWTKYNRRYWIDKLEDFAWFFWAQAIHEAHSTKQIEDCVTWTLQTTGELLSVEWDAPNGDVATYREWASQVECPMLVIHGEEDRLVPIARSRELSDLTGAEMVVMNGSGHIPPVRDPVRVNLLIKEFVDRIGVRSEVAA